MKLSLFHIVYKTYQAKVPSHYNISLEYLDDQYSSKIVMSLDITENYSLIPTERVRRLQLNLSSEKVPQFSGALTSVHGACNYGCFYSCLVIAIASLSLPLPLAVWEMVKCYYLLLWFKIWYVGFDHWSLQTFCMWQKKGNIYHTSCWCSDSITIVLCSPFVTHISSLFAFWLRCFFLLTFIGVSHIF